MIRYNYHFERDETDMVRSFDPSYPTEFFNIANLIGDSSTGKSTLLNMIAMAFYGYDDTKLPPILHKRVNYLYNNSKVGIDFEIELSSRSGRVLKSKIMKKRSENGEHFLPEIRVSEIDSSGKEHKLFKEEFRQKYRLLYDIPNNPTKRIEDGLREISLAQKTYSDKVLSLMTTADRIYDEIRKAKDPSAIANIREKLDEAQRELIKKESFLNEQKAHKQKLEELFWARKLKRIIDQITELEKESSEIKKEHKKIKKDFKEAKAEYELSVGNYKQKLIKLSEVHSISLKELKDVEQLKEIDEITISCWSVLKIDPYQNVSLKDVPDDYCSIASTLINLLEKQSNKYNSKEDLDKYTLYTQMMNILKGYLDTHSSIAILDKSADIFYEDLKKELTKIESKVSKYKIYKKAIETLTSCIQYANEAHSSYLKIPVKPVDYSDPDTDSEIEEKLADYRDSKKNIEMQASQHQINVSNYEKTINFYKTNTTYRSFCEMEIYSLSEEIRSVSRDISELGQHLYNPDGLQYKIKVYQDRLEQLEKCKEHPLQEYKDHFERLINALGSMQRDLSKKNAILDNFVNRDTELIKQNQSQDIEKYLKLVWRNLGKRFEQIQYIREVYDVEEVDLVKSCIITTTGKEISLNDMGTGESQSAYLKNVLRSNENMNIIALFDESEHMDYKLRRGILTNFKELYDSDHLFLGLMTSHAPKDDEPPTVEEYNGN